MKSGVPTTVPAVFFERAERYHSRTFLTFYAESGWQGMSWGDAAQKIVRVGCLLIQAGVKPGDRVALLSENRYEWIICDWAIQSIGAVTVPIYSNSAERTVHYIVTDAGIELAIASTPVLAAKFELGKPLRTVLRMDTDIAAAMATEAPRLENEQLTKRLAAVQPDQIATIVYTSGTTGEPKGVVLTHGHFLREAVAALQVIDLGSADIVLSYLPYAHVMERTDGVFVVMFAGGSLSLARSMDPLILVEDIKTVQPTVMLGVPRVFDKFHDAVYDQARRKPAYTRALFNWSIRTGAARLERAQDPILGLQLWFAERLVLRKLRTALTGGRLRFFISGGAPLNEKVEEFFWALGVKILQGWGMTETNAAATTNTETCHRFRTVGKPLPGTEIKIAEDGEIFVKGPSVMKGYFNKPAETAEAIEDGWLHTGDMGFIDQDGFLTITDRKKDLIKTSGGKYVAPLPLEAQLEADRYVQSSIVVGDRHPYVVALLVPDWPALAQDKGITGDPASLMYDNRARDYFRGVVDAVNAGQASFETIKDFALLTRDFSEAEGELTPTLKMKRKVIAEHFASVIDGLYQAGHRSAA